MSLNWKAQPAQYGGGESLNGIAFKEAYPELAKLLCDGAGNYIDKHECDSGGYHYKCKIVTKGTSTYTWITRKQQASNTTATTTQGSALSKEDYNEGARRGHEENKQMHREMLEALRHLSEMIAENTKAQNANGIILDTIREHCETLARDSTKKHAFETPVATATISTGEQT